MIVVIHCDYEEGKPHTYRGMWFFNAKREKVTFKSDIPERDLNDCITQLKSDGYEVWFSNSVDWFFIENEERE